MQQRRDQLCIRPVILLKICTMVTADQTALCNASVDLTLTQEIRCEMPRKSAFMFENLFNTRRDRTTACAFCMLNLMLLVECLFTSNISCFSSGSIFELSLYRARESTC